MQESLTTMVLTIIIALIVMVLLSCAVCLYIKLSDFKLRVYITEMAKKKGIAVNMDDLHMQCPECQSPLTNENCTIMVPDVGIII